MQRAKWFKIHSWVGVKLALLLCFVLVTGTLAVVSHEIDWVTNPAMRVSPSTVQGTDWAKIYQQALKTVPDHKILSLRAPVDPWFSAEVIYLQPDGSRHRLFFHPSNGEYLGDGRWYNWQRFFRMTHRHLMLPTVIGVSIIGVFGVLMLISLISSLFLYKGWWKGFLRLPRKQNRKIYWADMHRLLGVWSLWFVLIISVTGCWYLLENWGLRADYPDRGKARSAMTAQQNIQPSAATLSQALEMLPEAYPGLQTKYIVIPNKPGQSLQFHGQADTLLVRNRANLVSFDPITAELLVVNKGHELSSHARISEAADPLHFGTFAGWPSKLIYFVFGIILSALSITGTYMYGMRVSKQAKQYQRPQKLFWRSALAGMGWGKWLSISAVSVCLILVALIFPAIITP